MRVLQQPGSMAAMPDDQLGTVAVSLAVAELTWTPDVAPAVMDRIARDAVAYPEHFERRPEAAAARTAPPLTERSSQRTVGRLAVFAALLAVVAAFVVFLASASVADASSAADALDALARAGSIIVEAV